MINEFVVDPLIVLENNPYTRAIHLFIVNIINYVKAEMRIYLKEKETNINEGIKHYTIFYLLLFQQYLPHINISEVN